MALSGVRSSWLMLARNADLVRDAASASALALLGLFPGGADFARIFAEHRQRAAHVAEFIGPGRWDRRRQLAARDRQHAVGKLGQPRRHVAQHEQPDDQPGDHRLATAIRISQKRLDSIACVDSAVVAVASLLGRLHQLRDLRRAVRR